MKVCSFVALLDPMSFYPMSYDPMAFDPKSFDPMSVNRFFLDCRQFLNKKLQKRFLSFLIGLNF